MTGGKIRLCLDSSFFNSLFVSSLLTSYPFTTPLTIYSILLPTLYITLRFLYLPSYYPAAASGLFSLEESMTELKSRAVFFGFGTAPREELLSTCVVLV